MGKYILWIGLAIVVVAGAGYGGYLLGVQDGKQQATSIREQFLAQRQGTPQANGQSGFMSGQGAFAPGQGGLGGRGTAGTIKEIRDNTLIISTADAEVQVEVTADTRITMSTEGTISDLEVGERIFVNGQTDGDKMTATQIQAVPDLP